MARFIVATCFLVALSLNSNAKDTPPPPLETTFTRVLVDPNGPNSPWAKGIGDINRDGFADLVVGGHRSNTPSIPQKILRKLGLWNDNGINGDLVWYQSPNWEKHLISNRFSIRTSVDIEDLNNDGEADVVAATDQGLIWFSNPGPSAPNLQWPSHTINSLKFHDVVIGDLDGDGDLDIAARNQSLFNHNDGDQIYLFYQQPKLSWKKITIQVQHGEGLALADINNDDFPDIIVNGDWLKNPGPTNLNNWTSYSYTKSWSWQDVNIDVADFNGDGLPDIVLTPSEKEGQRYRISWFQAPKNPTLTWDEHIIDPDVESVHHAVQARDYNRDGYVDVLTSEMNQGKDPDNITIYYNNHSKKDWHKQVIATSGAHSLQAADVDNDFDVDFFGTNWQRKNYDGSYPVELWQNQKSELSERQWKRHTIDEKRPWKSVFIFAEDIDGDQYSDIITGGWWYKNPGSPSSPWLRHTIGNHANNVAAIHDFDNDGDLDVLSSRWENLSSNPSILTRALNRLNIKKHDYNPKGELFVWGQNNGLGEFEIFSNIDNARGDLLQGSALLEYQGNTFVALSWHKANQGIQLFNSPKQPSQDHWRWEKISSNSQDEQLSSGDIDNDGDTDLLLGTLWLEKTNSGWNTHTLTSTEQKPDRNQLYDMNNDGLLDAVIGYEAVSRPGELAWYEQQTDKTKEWIKHTVSTSLIGPMSLSLNDMDMDGDIDIIVGEHNLKNPLSSRLLWIENTNGKATSWRKHLVYQGDEHHNGAITIDIDNDGDFDILSIGWGHDRVLLYENTSPPLP